MGAAIDIRAKEFRLLKGIAWIFLITEAIWLIFLAFISFAALKEGGLLSTGLLWIDFFVFVWLTLGIVKTQLSPELNIKVIIFKLLLIGLLFISPLLLFAIYLSISSMC